MLYCSTLYTILGSDTFHIHIYSRFYIADLFASLRRIHIYTIYIIELAAAVSSYLLSNYDLLEAVGVRRITEFYNYVYLSRINTIFYIYVEE